MISKEKQAFYRNELFRHLDGIVIAPSVQALYENGVIDYLRKHDEVDLTTLSKHFNANEGYLNVALRLLSSQGWLNQEVIHAENRVCYKMNSASSIAFDLIPWYQNSVNWLKTLGTQSSHIFSAESLSQLEKLYHDFDQIKQSNLSADPSTLAIQEQILFHIEGVMVAPLLVNLGMSGMFHKYFMETRFRPDEFHKEPMVFSRILDVLTGLHWFQKVNDTYEFTEKGLFFARRASSYGVTVSYLPTLSRLNDLIFGDARILKSTKKGAAERHVDREMNVWGSGGAHGAYFKAVDEIIIKMFNQPIADQPKGVLDMGCGNGAFLIHLFSVIESQTERGKVLEEHPLTLIGVDYNQAALNVTRANLIQADIWAKVVWGDIGDPDLLGADLKEKYDIELGDLLNVRTFLDHNRIWEEPKNSTAKRLSTSTGAYAFEGDRINCNLVSKSLKYHFEKWTPYVHKYGLLLIELHTVKPQLIAQNLGQTAVTAYDATHGYSDQYIIEIDEFVTVLAEAGLLADQRSFRKYPDNELATVSVNLYKSR